MARKVDSRWSIAIYSGPSPLALSPDPRAASPVLTGHDVRDLDASFVADPFMHFDGVRWSMFFEVLNRATAQGEIGLATSDDAIRWRYERIVLAEEFHLSYPFVFSHRGEHFMVPETFEAGQVRLYRATRWPYEWTLDTVLIDDVIAVDASLFPHGGAWWMFACTRRKENDELSLWRADDPRGPWRAHPSSPVVRGDNRIGRPGGRPVAADGTLYRFAQDCQHEYGVSVRAIEITRLTATEYAESEVSREPIIVPGAYAWSSRRTHHVDPHQLPDGTWIACVDGEPERE